MKKKLMVIGMMVMMVLTAAGCKKQECIGCGEMKKCNERNIGGETLYICDSRKEGEYRR